MNQKRKTLWFVVNGEVSLIIGIARTAMLLWVNIPRHTHTPF